MKIKIENVSKLYSLISEGTLRYQDNSLISENHPLRPPHLSARYPWLQYGVPSSPTIPYLRAWYPWLQYGVPSSSHRPLPQGMVSMATVQGAVIPPPSPTSGHGIHGYSTGCRHPPTVPYLRAWYPWLQYGVPPSLHCPLPQGMVSMATVWGVVIPPPSPTSGHGIHGYSTRCRHPPTVPYLRAWYPWLQYGVPSSPHRPLPQGMVFMATVWGAVIPPPSPTSGHGILGYSMGAVILSASPSSGHGIHGYSMGCRHPPTVPYLRAWYPWLQYGVPSSPHRPLPQGMVSMATVVWGAVHPSISKHHLPRILLYGGPFLFGHEFRHFRAVGSILSLL